MFPRIAILLTLTGLATIARAEPAYELDPIRYSTAPSRDPVAKLQSRLDAGAAKLSFGSKDGYLKSILRELKIPASSQSLVFSKTSFQRDEISPQSPRALYFDDNTYVGWVRGGKVLEVASTDPKLGTVFYTLDQTPSAKPTFLRQSDRCLQCHGTTMTGDVPGLMVRSVHTDPYGMPVLTAGTSLTSQATPLEERWGGWYVTGTHGTLRHQGNVTAKDRDDDSPMNVESGANVTSLADRFDTNPYLTPHSDLVALMVLAHQAEAHNLFTQLSYQTRWAIRDSKAINEALGNVGASAGLSDSARRRISSAGEKLFRCLLFCDEELLTDHVRGTSTYAADFTATGPRDRKGRSLREFDLHRRVFKYPLSYLIYSPSFDELPAEAKDYLYRRLHEVLSGKEAAGEFKLISTEERRAILEILRDTKPNLPAYFF